MFIITCNNSTVKPNVKVKVTSDYVYNELCNNSTVKPNVKVKGTSDYVYR